MSAFRRSRPSADGRGARRRRTVLLILLVLSALNYYYWDVQLKIAKLPQLLVFVDVPNRGDVVPRNFHPVFLGAPGR